MEDLTENLGWKDKESFRTIYDIDSGAVGLRSKNGLTSRQIRRLKNKKMKTVARFKNKDNK